MYYWRCTISEIQKNEIIEENKLEDIIFNAEYPEHDDLQFIDRFYTDPKELR